MPVELGAVVRDKISGVKGIVVGRAEYLYRSPTVNIGIREMDGDGKPNESVWLNESQCEPVDEPRGKLAFPNT